MSYKKKISFKDILICIIILGIAIYISKSYFNNVTPETVHDKIFSLISILILYILSLITLFDVADTYGFSFIVPTMYSNNKKNKQENVLRCILSEYYVNETAFLKNYSDEKIKFFMNQLGLTQEQFEDIRLEILKIQLMKAGTPNEIQNKLREICTNQFVLIKSSDYLPVELVYHEVKYYLNFTDIMYGPLGDDIPVMFASFIKEQLKRDINKLDKIVVSENGNFLLGLRVSHELKKNFIKMLPKQRIFKKQFWEGSFKVDEKIIIVHDVLVTAKQIIDSISHFPTPSTNMGVFCLINRIDHEGKAELKSRKIKVYSILDLSDDDIEKMILAKG